MITLNEFFDMQNYTPLVRRIYERRYNHFISRFPDKKKYSRSDIRQYCRGSLTYENQMKAIEKYFRVNSLLIEDDQKEKPENRLGTLSPRRLTIENGVKKYLQAEKRKVRPKTLLTKNYYLKSFVKFVSGVGFSFADQIDFGCLTSFKDFLFRAETKTGLNISIKSQSNHLIEVRLLFGFLVREGFLLTNPSKNLTVPRQERRISRNVLTRNEIDNFLNTIDTSNLYGFIDRTIFELLYSTGLRLGELYSLKLKNINFDDGLITVIDGKGLKDRVCVLTGISKKYLKVYVEELRQKYLNPGVVTKYLFPSIAGKKKKANDPNLNRRIKKLLQKAGIKKRVTVHGFRHSFATHLLQEGVDVRYIQRLMGHKDVNSTLEYLKINVDDLVSALQTYHPREKILSGLKISFKGSG